MKSVYFWSEKLYWKYCPFKLWPPKKALKKHHNLEKNLRMFKWKWEKVSKDFWWKMKVILDISSFLFFVKHDRNMDKKFFIIPERNINCGKIVVFVDNRSQPRIQRIWHDLEASLDTGDNEINIVTSALFRAHCL